MLHRTKLLLAVIAAIFLVTSYWGCSRIKNDFSENKPPEVHFVNIPLDSTTFNYAPVVRWYGYDPDGLVDAFQYHDDSTAAAKAAYDSDLVHPGTLQAYINAVPSSAWITTYNSADTIYLRRAETDTFRTQHVFMIRCVDNRGAYSSVKVRTYFRTNNPPNTPLVKWALDVTISPPHNYDSVYTVPDTLFWGDTLTSTYGGVGFLWQGTDPDSRALNIIPLTFSYLLRNVTTGDTFPYPLLDDSNHVVGYRKGWSPWRSDAQVTFSAASAFAVDSNFQLDGQYAFTLKVRDDGLTEAADSAVAFFKAVGAVSYNDQRPLLQHNFENQLLLVDWTAHPVNSADSTGGMRNDQQITDFYNQVVPVGLQLAEAARAYAPDVYPTPISDSIAWYLDKDLTQTNRVPYDYIRHFKWIWVISDNVPRNASATGALPRIKVFEDYMKVGGQVMMSGRGLFRTLGVASGCKDVDPSILSERYLRDYFNLKTICAQPQYVTTIPRPVADFGGATTTDALLPQIEMDSVMVHNLNFRGQHLWCLPEVDYFGRSGASNGTDYTVSLYNYNSCSANASYNADSIDCDVESSTPSRAFLLPLTGHTRILTVSRVYNLTRQVEGHFMYVDREQLSNGALGPWRIVVSTPADHGAWLTSDALAVYYTYIPIQPSHDQPVASDYIRFQSVVSYNRYTGEFGIDLTTRFRTGLCCYPLSFAKNESGQVAGIVAYEALFFNQLKVYRTNFAVGGGGGNPNP